MTPRVREVTVKLVLVEPDNGSGWSIDDISDVMGLDDMSDDVLSVEILTGSNGAILPIDESTVRDPTPEEIESMAWDEGD
jgi:hypothetical protein